MTLTVEQYLASQRRGVRVRVLDGGQRSVLEVENVGELERLRENDLISRRQYDAGVDLRYLWREGTLLSEPSVSCLVRLAEPGSGKSDLSDRRLEMNDSLRGALRQLGCLADFIVAVVVHDYPVKSRKALEYVQDALDRLASYFESTRREAA